MAEKYGVSAAQLCIRYAIQLGTVALPKTANPAHMASNAKVDFAISDADMEALRQVEHISRLWRVQYFPGVQRQAAGIGRNRAKKQTPGVPGVCFVCSGC